MSRKVYVKARVKTLVPVVSEIGLVVRAASVEAQARSATPTQAVPGKKSMTPSRPMLRVIHPNDEPPQDGSR